MVWVGFEICGGYHTTSKMPTTVTKFYENLPKICEEGHHLIVPAGRRVVLVLGPQCAVLVQTYEYEYSYT